MERQSAPVLCSPSNSGSTEPKAEILDLAIRSSGFLGIANIDPQPCLKFVAGIF